MARHRWGGGMMRYVWDGGKTTLRLVNSTPPCPGAPESKP